MFYLLAALCIGAIVPIQTAANSRLRQSVRGKPIVSALISFTIALTLAALATAVTQGNPLPQFAEGVNPPWWGGLGGVFGVLFIVGNILLFAKLGAVQTVVLPILGQVIMGLLIDRFGLFRARQMEISVWRLLGVVLVLVGIAVVLRIGRTPIGYQETQGGEAWLFRALGVTIGMGSSMQTAVNGYMGTIAGSALHAAEINLAVGAVLLLILAAVTAPRQLGTRPAPGPWWMWLGGVVGAIFVTGGAALAPKIGTATTVIAINAGTIAGGQVMESMGAFGARKTPMDATRLVGLAIIFLGVVAVRLL